MICKNCGKELTSEDRFCSRCGSKIEIEVVEPFEEVVFNPPFRIENEMKEEQPPKKKFDTIDFTWDLSGYPTENETGKKPVEKIDFNWGAKVPEPKPEPVEETPVVEEPVPEEKLEPEAIEDFLGKNDLEKEEEIEVESETDIDTVPDTYEDGMPKGNGITTEAFLEELRNHVPREERFRQEELNQQSEEAKNDFNVKKGLKSFFKGTFLEPETSIGEEAIEEVKNEETKPQLQVVSILPCSVQTMAVMAPEPEKVDEPEVFVEAIPEAKPEIENLQAQDMNEINEFLPKDKQETGEASNEADATRIVDKFYTFNQKNIEFQKLLDQEYDKIRGQRSMEEIKAEVKQSNQEAGQMAKEILMMKESAKNNHEQKPGWDEIFSEEEEEEEKHKSGVGKFFGIILLILIIVFGGAFGLVKFLPDAEATKFIKPYFDSVLSLVGIEIEADQGQVQDIQQFIDNQISHNKHIGEVVYDNNLIIDLDKTYDMPGVSDSKEFKNGSFTKIDGTKTSYGDMITAALISHYSAKSGKLKPGQIDLLKIGNYRVCDEGYFAIVKITESGADKGTQMDRELVYLVLKGDNIVINQIEAI